jgi:hypothetical protein
LTPYDENAISQTEENTSREVLLENFDIDDSIKDVSAQLPSANSSVHPLNTTLPKNKVFMTDVPKKMFVKPYEDERFFEKAFPWLFPYGDGGPTDILRPRKLSNADYDAHTMRESSRRFTHCPIWMATRYRYRTNEACSYLAQHASTNNFNRTLTVGDLRNLQEHTENGQHRNRFNKEMENILKTIISHGKNMKTSFMYIKNERRKLLARLSSPVMSDPVWFVTLSSADLYWPEFWKAIYPESTMEECKSFSYEERQKSLRDNPAMACRMFRSRIDNILKYIIKGDSHPIGYLVDWWFRIEFQNRGSLHVHAILWALLHYQMGEQIWWDGDELCNLVAGLTPPTQSLFSEFSK